MAKLKDRLAEAMQMRDMKQIERKLFVRRNCKNFVNAIFVIRIVVDLLQIKKGDGLNMGKRKEETKPIFLPPPTKGGKHEETMLFLIVVFAKLIPILGETCQKSAFRYRLLAPV